MSTILLVDDDDGFRSMVYSLLTKKGYTVIEAVDGEDGLKKFHENSPDLVITDIIMPEQDGTGLILELNKMKSEVPIIAMSGGGRIAPEEYLDMAERLGAMRTLTKPIERDELLGAIKELLE